MTTPPAPSPSDTTVRPCGGLELPDPYGWLRASDWRAALRDPARLDEAIRRHLEAENAYLDSELAALTELRSNLKAELRGRIPERDWDVGFADGPYTYYTRFEEGRQYRLYCRRRRGVADEAREEILLDADGEAAGQTFFKVAQAAHSPDHRLFAYAVDVTGSEYHALRVRDPGAGRRIDLDAKDLAGDLVWANDGRTLFYTALDANHRASRVYRIAIDGGGPELVYEESDPGFYLHVDMTESRRFILIECADHADTAEVHLIDAEAPDTAPMCVRARETGLDYAVAERDGVLYLLTNANGALDYKIATVPAADATKTPWRDLVPHRPGVLIRRMLLFRDYLVRLEMAEALPRIVVRRLDTGAEWTVPLEHGDEAYVVSLRRGHEFDTACLRLSYASPRRPETTYDCDLASGRLTWRKTQEIPSGHDPEAYVVRRFAVASHDGAAVPVTLLHRRDSPPDGRRPLLLYGYGAYGMAIPAGFAADRFSLVDRGITYAIAHVRGGSERGHRWYLDGKLEKKTNTFDDYLAVADALIAQRFVREGGIVANGRSAGGMLMGVVANRRPELFHAVVAEVPFVDVLNTMCDAELPLTPPEWPEWGNPLEDPDACRRIAGYSPYDNITPQAYPEILATAGITDPRVTYWEPAKWVARLRANNTGSHRVLLHTNMTAGHAGAAGRFARLDEVALVQAFILAVCGVASDAPAPQGSPQGS